MVGEGAAAGWLPSFGASTMKGMLGWAVLLVTGWARRERANDLLNDADVQRARSGRMVMRWACAVLVSTTLMDARLVMMQAVSASGVGEYDNV